MKILQVGSSLPGSGGIEKFLLHLSEGLRARRHDVQIAAIPDSWLWQQAGARQFETVALHVRRQQDWAALGSCRSVLRAGRYDIVNTHFSPDYIVPAIAAHLERQRGLVMTRHVVKPWHGLMRWLYGEALYPRIIGVSHAVRAALLSGGIAPQRVITVHGATPSPDPNGQATPLRRDLNLPDNCVLIGIVSRLAAEKGHHCLLEAMTNVDRRAVCIIAGNGPEEENLRAFVRTNHLEGCVRFLGWREDSEAIIRALDIVVQPSLWEEAWGLAIMEAMALAKPVVATRTGGIPEIVVSGKSGLLVSKNDPVALADALNALVTDPVRCEQMGCAGRERQQTHFSIAALAANTEAVYIDLLTNG